MLKLQVIIYISDVIKTSPPISHKTPKLSLKLQNSQNQDQNFKST